MPANTIGRTTLNPGSGLGAGWRVSVIVSPTFVSVSSLMLAMTKPTSPVPSDCNSSGWGEKTPTFCTSYAFPVAMKVTRWPDRIAPSSTRARTTTPA